MPTVLLFCVAPLALKAWRALMRRVLTFKQSFCCMLLF